MSSDLSRLIFDKKKHFSGVRMQQGRVLLDSDWNAQSDIFQNRIQTQTIDVIGKSGVPLDSNGFQLIQQDNGCRLTPGRIYVNGLLCELENEISLNPGDDALIIQEDETSMPYAYINGIPNSGSFIAYIKAWQREISYLDDPIIREKALGNPDTTTRLQTVWQLKFSEIGDNQQCEDVNIPQFELAATGQMEARTVTAEESDNPCDFNQSSGYRRLENQLYRVEIHSGGNANMSTYKWSRENASVRANVTRVTGSDSVQVHSLGRDNVLGFQIGDWVEFTNHELSLSRNAGPLLQITEIDPGTLEITVNGNINTVDENGLKVVRWDQATDAISVSNSFMPLEDGIEVRFTAGSYQEGDYWLIPARTIDSSIEWNLGNFESPKAGNVGHAKIGILEISNTVVQSIQDCRPLFPPLTDLPKGGRGCSTYHVSHEPGWERVFNRIARDEDAKICFAIGKYTLNSTIEIRNKGHLLITGCGPGTSITANNHQVAFRFEDCKSVDISNMSISTNEVKSRIKSDVVSLKGCITTVNVPKINITKIHLQCGHNIKHQASCITCFNTTKIHSTVTIAQNELNVGYGQIGILLINGGRSVIENNIIKVKPKPSNLSINDRLISNNRLRNTILKDLISNFSSEHNSFTNQNVTFQNITLSFRTNPDLKKNVWQKILNENPPNSEIRNTNDLKKHLKKLALNQIYQKESRNSTISNHFNILDQEEPSIGFQGIVIGGRKSEESRISNNYVLGFLQGVHIGMSHSDKSGKETDFIDSVIIEKNKIKNNITISNDAQRHGIFIGNCRRIYIDNNELELHRPSKANNVVVDAIQIWGYLGRMGTITNNHIFNSISEDKSYNKGIKIVNLNSEDNTLKWNINWNSIQVKSANKLDLPPNFLTKYLDTNS